MKKVVVFSTILIFILGIVLYFFAFRDVGSNAKMYKNDENISYKAKTETDSIYIYEGDKWNKTFLRGVNIGATKPGYFPGEFGITKDDYMRWFRYISDMNANTIRVYTILKPEFYDALYEFNRKSDKPLYLMQGVWINEDDIAEYKDAYNVKIKEEFKKDIEHTIDLLHGDETIEKRPGLAYGTYKHDVSGYVIGYILGIEWDPEFVAETNKQNEKAEIYKGKYLYTEEATPFENFLCEIGDSCIKYELEKYNKQTCVSFTNWVTTDMLNHPNEPLTEEDLVSVNPTHIKATENLKTGVFASYHIYPYYPDLMNYQKEYVEFKDGNGKINTYRAYLEDLKSKHTIPIIAAEFGVPSSRGKAHDSLYLGYNQGNIEESAQGNIDAAMLNDIYEAGYAGGIVFSFQDEWFKRTWNTMEYDLPDRRPYWNNQQTNEQHFGLLAFDPGKKTSVCYVDGKKNEWVKKDILISDKNYKIYAKSDEAYLYLMLENYNIDKGEPLIIPLDTMYNQGNDFYGGKAFERSADFIISIEGRSNSKVLVDSYYDTFTYTYGDILKMFPVTDNYSKKNSGEFSPIYLCTNRELYLPQDDKTIPLQKYETGLLHYGNGNPESDEYDSLADFCASDTMVEMRIPWQLINIMDPSTLAAIGDFHGGTIEAKKIKGIYIGNAVNRESSVNEGEQIKMKLYSWKSWEEPSYHERLKPSYYILKKAFSKYN